jgi:hypothetical protein
MQLWPRKAVGVPIQQLGEMYRLGAQPLGIFIVREQVAQLVFEHAGTARLEQDERRPRADIVAQRVDAIRLSLEPDETQAGLRVEATLEMTGRLEEKHLQRRPHVGFDQVAAMRRAIALPHDGVGVDARLPFSNTNVTHEREHLDLLPDGDVRIVFPLPVEEGQDGVAKGADRREVAASERLIGGERPQHAHRLFAGLEDDGVGSLLILLMELFPLHGVVLAQAMVWPPRSVNTSPVM